MLKLKKDKEKEEEEKKLEEEKKGDEDEDGPKIVKKQKVSPAELRVRKGKLNMTT